MRGPSRRCLRPSRRLTGRADPDATNDDGRAPESGSAAVLVLRAEPRGLDCSCYGWITSKSTPVSFSDGSIVTSVLAGVVPRVEPSGKTTLTV